MHCERLLDHLVRGHVQVCGTWTPSALAVFRLIASSYLSDCSNGRAVGLFI